MSDYLPTVSLCENCFKAKNLCSCIDGYKPAQFSLKKIGANTRCVRCDGKGYYPKTKKDVIRLKKHAGINKRIKEVEYIADDLRRAGDEMLRFINACAEVEPIQMTAKTWETFQLGAKQAKKRAHDMIREKGFGFRWDAR